MTVVAVKFSIDSEWQMYEVIVRNREPHCISFNLQVNQCMAVVINKTKQGNSVLFLLLTVYENIVP